MCDIYSHINLCIDNIPQNLDPPKMHANFKKYWQIFKKHANKKNTKILKIKKWREISKSIQIKNKSKEIKNCMQIFF